MEQSVFKKLLFAVLLVKTCLCDRQIRLPSGEPYMYPSLDSNNTCPNKTTPLYFGLIQSFSASQLDGSGTVAGVNVALDRINRNCSLLPGYSLHYTVADSQCERTSALDALFMNTLFSSTKIAVIGSGCSPATEPTAEVSHYYNISQISCQASSAALSNRTRYRSYFQLLNNYDTLAYAYHEVIKEYGWTHVSLIVQNERVFIQANKVLKKLLDKENISYDERSFTTDEGIAGLGEEPFNRDRRVHLIASYSEYARQLVCEAYSRGIYLPRHVLLTPAWYRPYWWRVEGNYSCTVEQREMVLKGSIAFNPFSFINRNGTDDVVTTDGLTDDKYLELEAYFLTAVPLNLTVSPYAQYCYDAVWTLTYALHSTLTDLEDKQTNQNLSKAYSLGPGEVFRLNNFTYSSDALVNIIFRHLSNTSFDGITGPVRFDDYGIREVTKLSVYQFRANSSGLINWVEIGQVINNNQSTYTFNRVSGESNENVWPNGVPYDGVPVDATATIHIAMTVVYFILMTAGIAFAVFCLFFNLCFRDKKLIKLTSPNLNLVIGVGAIILYVNLYLFIFPVTDPTTVAVLCNLTPWLTAIGYSLCYGTVVVKMTRVYHIFNSPSPKKTKVQDWKLFLGVLSLVVVDVIILTVYTIVEYIHGLEEMGIVEHQVHKVTNRENPEDELGDLSEITKYFIYVCDTRAKDIMLGVLYGYKALLQVIALIFSFSIRKVKVRGLDDAKFIAASIYVSSIVLAVIIVSTYTLKDFLNVFPVVFCTGFLIGTTVILGLVFVPLMVGLYKDPKGEKIFEKSTLSTATPNFQSQTMEDLKKRVTELEAIVANKKGNSNQVESTFDSIPSWTLPQEKQDNFHEMAKPPRRQTNTIWDNHDDGTNL